jgi:hypothetical protein
MDERAWESSAVSSLHRAVARQSHTYIADLSALFFFARSRGGRRCLKPLFHSFLFIGTAGGPVCAGRKTQVLSFMLCCTAMSSIERHSEHERHWQDDSHRHREPIFQSPLLRHLLLPPRCRHASASACASCRRRHLRKSGVSASHGARWTAEGLHRHQNCSQSVRSPFYPRTRWPGRSSARVHGSRGRGLHVSSRAVPARTFPDF